MFKVATVAAGSLDSDSAKAKKNSGEEASSQAKNATETPKIDSVVPAVAATAAAGLPKAQPVASSKIN